MHTELFVLFDVLEKVSISLSLLPDLIEFDIYCTCCYFLNKILFKLYT